MHGNGSKAVWAGPAGERAALGRLSAGGRGEGYAPGWWSPGPLGEAGVGLPALEGLPGRGLVCRAGTESGRGGARPVPRWDRDSRTLRVGGRLVKRLLSTATRQAGLLDALEKAGWPPRLPNPVKAKKRFRTRWLRDGVRSLNCAQEARLLDFKVEMAAEGAELTWRYVP